MDINEIVFFVTKVTTYEIAISKEEGYDMPETAKGLVDMVTAIKNNPAQELAWSSSNVVDDVLTIDDYEIKENK